MMRAGRTFRITSLGALCLTAALGGCGSDARFTADEFVRDVNREGVKLRLGQPLTTDEEGKELYAVQLAPLGPPRVDDHGDRVVTGGSISVYDENEGDPDDELRNCEQAADLLCYRLDNIVIVLEGGGIETQQLGAAMEKLAGD